MLFSIELDGTYIWFKWFGGTVFEGTTFDRSTFLKELWINKTERTGQLACRLADEMQDEWWITTQLSSQLKSSDIKWYYQLKNGLSLIEDKPSYEAIKWRFSVDDQWWWSDFKHTRGWSFDEHLENWDGHKTNLIRINSNNFIYQQREESSLILVKTFEQKPNLDSLGWSGENDLKTNCLSSLIFQR